jgi:putative Mg2+ transporter-C (MgtC) family protein
MAHQDYMLLARIAVGFILAYILGFEREVRGSPAGDRTFALVGAGATAITAVVYRTSPQAVAGVVTGVGFIGAGVVFQSDGGTIRGITTAASIFAAAAIGIVVGYGHLVLGLVTTAVIVFTLETRHIRALSRLDGRRYRGRFKDDMAPPQGMDTTPD